MNEQICHIVLRPNIGYNSKLTKQQIQQKKGQTMCKYRHNQRKCNIFYLSRQLNLISLLLLFCLTSSQYIPYLGYRSYMPDIPTGHNILSIDFSNSGQFMAVVVTDGTFLLYKLEDDAQFYLYHNFGRAPDLLWVTYFTPDDKWLLTGCFDTNIRVYKYNSDTNDYEYFQILLEPVWHVRDISATPDTTRLAVADQGFHIHVYDITDSGFQFVGSGGQTTYSIYIDPNGVDIYMGIDEDSRFVKYSETSPGSWTEVGGATLPSPQGYVDCLVYMPEHGFFAIGSRQGRIYVYTPTFVLKQTLVVAPGVNLRALSYIDGILAAVSQNSRATIFYFNENSQEFEQKQDIWLTGKSGGSIELSNNSQYLAVGTESSDVLIFYQCDVEHCLSCSRPNFCQICSQPTLTRYFIDYETGQCETCAMDYCLQCESISSCRLCQLSPNPLQSYELVQNQSQQYYNGLQHKNIRYCQLNQNITYDNQTRQEEDDFQHPDISALTVQRQKQEQNKTNTRYFIMMIIAGVLGFLLLLGLLICLIFDCKRSLRSNKLANNQDGKEDHDDATQCQNRKISEEQLFSPKIISKNKTKSQRKKQLKIISINITDQSMVE